MLVLSAKVVEIHPVVVNLNGHAMSRSFGRV